MAAGRKASVRIRRRAWRGNLSRFAAAFGFALSCVHGAEVAAQQAPSGVYVTGNAAVTGFSGALPPIQIAPGVDPNLLTFIDPNGPSLRVVDLQHMGGPV